MVVLIIKLVIAMIIMFVISFPPIIAIVLSYKAGKDYEASCLRRVAPRFETCPLMTPVKKMEFHSPSPKQEPEPEEDSEEDTEEYLEDNPEAVESPEENQNVESKSITLEEWVTKKADMLLRILEQTGNHVITTEMMQGVDILELQTWLLEQNDVSIVMQAPDGIEFVVEQRRD